ncbi:MAG TPA: energy transducer TonB, partial [Polyangiaceae bacterium]|nr:energy transducer TonB [Polyangiaceae bacterium]
TRTQAGPPEGEPSSAPMTAPADSNAAGWTLSPFASQGPPHSGGAAPAGSAFDEAVRAGVRATVAESAKMRDSRKHLLGGYSPHDIELGLIPGGEFIGFTRDGVRSSRAPNVGHATVEITIDGSGNLTAVRVLDASSNRFEWDEAAQEIMKSAQGHRTRVPSGSQGVVLTLDVSSNIRTVSGLPPATTALGRMTRAIGDPLDAIVDSTVPLQRVIAARVLDVTVL